MMYAYVPTAQELEHIRRLRREIEILARSLQAKRQELVDYNAAISAGWNCRILQSREVA